MTIDATKLTSDEVNTLLVIYLDGFTSGFSTAMLTSGVSRERAEDAAQRVGNNALRDPIIAEIICDNIKARLAGDIGTDHLLPVNWDA